MRKPRTVKRETRRKIGAGSKQGRSAGWPKDPALPKDQRRVEARPKRRPSGRQQTRSSPNRSQPNTLGGPKTRCVPSRLFSTARHEPPLSALRQEPSLSALRIWPFFQVWYEITPAIAPPQWLDSEKDAYEADENNREQAFQHGRFFTSRNPTSPSVPNFKKRPKNDWFPK